MGEIEYRVAEGAYAEAMVELEHLCFPTLGDEDLLTVEGILLQEEMFPEGAYMALDGDRVVGMGSGIFVDFDINHPQHAMGDVVGRERSETMTQKATGTTELTLRYTPIIEVVE